MICFRSQSTMNAEDGNGPCAGRKFPALYAMIFGCSMTTALTEVSKDAAFERLFSTFNTTVGLGAHGAATAKSGETPRHIPS